jgi:hypothetical protein
MSMNRRAMLTLVVCGIAIGSLPAAERAWQEAVWQEATVERPAVSFGIGTRDPATGLPRAPTTRETRTCIVETATDELELRQEATSVTPRIDASAGATVHVAIEKKTVYLKDVAGREHKLTLQKKTPLDDRKRRDR